MNWKRMWAMFLARNYEFFRDRAAFGWNFLFPFLIIVGFGIIFSGRDFSGYKVGMFPAAEHAAPMAQGVPDNFAKTRYLQFIGFASREAGMEKLRQHKVDFLLDLDSRERAYWINDSSPKGYIVERLFWASFVNEANAPGTRQVITGRETRYIDWLFPGVLGMNMMFSALWGVGYVVVRYRKNGVLKRLKATPLTALEYLTAQSLSRIFLLLFTLIVVWLGSDLIFNFHVEGSFVDIAVVFFLGCLALTSLGLVLAARGTSEEFTSGVLNFITWPMMFLSEVWFSIEGAPKWVKIFSQFFPLTHILTAVRRIMSEGAGLAELWPQCLALIGFTLAGLAVGALLFSWNE